VLIGGHKGGVIVVEVKGTPHTIEIHWYCPVTDREIRIWISGSVEGAGFKLIQNEIISRTTCHLNLKRGARGMPVFPSLGLPNSFKRVHEENPYQREYTDASRVETFLLGMGERTDALTGKMAIDAEFRRKKAIFNPGYEDIDVDPKALTVKGRRFWKATARSRRGTKIFEAITVWYCRKSNMSFLAQYVGTTKAGRDEAIQTLADIACP
jgi:hypothetical protein